MSSDLQLISQESSSSEYEEEWNPRLIDVVAPVFLFCYVGLGTLIYTWSEDWSTWSSIYFCIITLSTVGYGDMTPGADYMKLFTLLYVYGGLFFFATVLGSFAGRDCAENDDNSDYESDEDIPKWPDVPIQGGPVRTTSKTRIVISKYRQDITQRWMKIVKAGTVIFLLASIATIFFACNEEFSALTAVYFTFVTMCTVGYGDISMTKMSSKVFDVVFVLLGVPLMVYITMLLATQFSKKMRRRMFKNFSKKGVTMELIEAIAQPKTGKVLRPDFLAYLLVFGGKVKAMDINKVNQLFDDIDEKGTGNVDVKDLRTYMKDKSLLSF